jgi:hypothetical protein
MVDDEKSAMETSSDQKPLDTFLRLRRSQCRRRSLVLEAWHTTRDRPNHIGASQERSHSRHHRQIWEILLRENTDQRRSGVRRNVLY